MLNSQMINFISTLKDVGLEYQKTFIYAINNSSGKFTKDDEAIPSKDILTPGAGMDCVGKLHIGGGGSNKNKDERVKNKLIRNRFRLFNKEDYGYYKIDSSRMPFKFPSDSSIPQNKLNTVSCNEDLIFEKMFNMEQLSIETVRMREYIEEKFQPLDMIKKEKSKVSSQDIEALRKFRLQKLKNVI